MAEYKTKVLIIGSGPAGYTAGFMPPEPASNRLLSQDNRLADS
jgi:hypothetical protein